MNVQSLSRIGLKRNSFIGLSLFFGFFFFASSVFGQAPTITSFSPAGAQVGETVTITGTNFNSTPSNNFVYFGGVKALVTQSTATSLTVEVPNGSTRCFITVTTGGLTAQSSRYFNLLNNQIASAPATSFADRGTVANTSAAFSDSDVIVGAGDFDNDGWPDIFKAGFGELYVNRNLLTVATTPISTTHFGPRLNFPIQGGVVTVATGDLDSDGKLDIITGSSTGISILRNTSTGVGNITFASSNTTNPRSDLSGNVTSIKIVDFNYDGKLDVAAITSSSLNIYINNSTPGSISFSSPTTFSPSTTGFNGIDVGDLNGDGKIDLAVSKSNLTNVFINTSSNGTLNLSSPVSISVGHQYLIIDDLDNDGKNDLYLYNKFLKNGYTTGTFSSSAFSEFTISVVNEGSSGCSAADLNGDGFPEIFVGTFWDKVRLLVNSGTGISTSIFSNFNAYNRGTAIGLDLNRDQKVDFISSMRDQSADIRLYENTSVPPPTLTFSNTLSPFTKCGTSPSAVQQITVTASNVPSSAQLVLDYDPNFEYSKTINGSYSSNQLTYSANEVGSGGTFNFFIRYIGSGSSSGNLNFFLANVNRGSRAFTATTSTGLASFGNSLNFDGTDDFVEIADDNTLDLSSAFTIEAWVFPTESGASRGQMIIGKVDDTQNGNSADMAYSLRFGANGFRAEIGNGTLYAVKESGIQNVKLNQWQHVALVFDGSTTSLNLYLDGVVQGSPTTTGFSSVKNSSASLKLGAYSTTFGQYFKGGLDEVRIWSVAKTQAQIQSMIYSQLTGAQTNLVVQYNFNQGTAGGTNTGLTSLAGLNAAGSAAHPGTFRNIALTGTASNFVSNSLNEIAGVSSTCAPASYTFPIAGGTWASGNTSVFTVNTAGLITPVAPGTANLNYTYSLYGCSFVISKSITITGLASFGNTLDFDGSNDYISTSDNNALDLTTNYTLEAWVKADGFTWLGGIISKYHSNNSNGYVLRSNQTSPYTGLSFDGAETANGVLQQGVWHHIAAVKQGNVRKLYVDGVEIPLTGGSAHTTAANNDALIIGKDFLADSFNRFWNGKIDEVRIWNVAKTQAQIQAAKDAELVGNESGLVLYYNFNQGTAGASNSSITRVLDGTSAALNATFTNFGLSGTNSNFVQNDNAPVIVGSASLCAGATATYTFPTSGGTWTSSNANIFTVSSSGSVTAVATGTANLTYTFTNNSCTFTVTKSITVTALPTITGALQVRTGNTLQLTGSGSPASSSPWVSSSTGVATVSNLGLVTAVAAGTTTITYTASTGCSVTQSITVFALTATASQTQICSGESVDLTLNRNDGTVQWQVSTNGTSNWTNVSGGTTSPFTVQNLTATRFYRASYTNTGFQPSFSNVLTVTVSALPAAPTVSNITLCLNATAAPLTATASSNHTLRWYTAATGGTHTAAPTPSTGSLGATTYYVSQISSSGCEGPRAALTVTVADVPAAPVADAAQLFCGSAPTLYKYARIVFSDVQSYASANSIQVSEWRWLTGNTEISRTGTTVTNPGGSNPSGEGPQNIYDGNTSTKWLDFNIKSSGRSSTLLFTFPGQGFEITGYSWSTANDSPERDPKSWKVFMSVDGTNWTEVDSKTGIAAPSGRFTTAGSWSYASPVGGSNVGGLTATALTGHTLRWYTVATGGTGTSTAPAINANNPGVFTYYVSQVNAGGCESPRTAITATVAPIPSAPTVSNITYCIGGTATALTATAGSGNTLNWYTAATGGTASSTAPVPTTSAAGTTTYYVSQVNPTGCESERAAITVTVTALPVISGGTSVGAGNTLQLSATTNPAFSNAWTSSDPAVATVSATGQVLGLATGTTTITYTNVNGCAVSQVVTVVAGTTQNPVLTAPASNTSGSTTLQFTYTLPEAPLAGSVKLTFTPAGGGTPIVWTMGNSVSVSFAYEVGANPTASSAVIAGSALGYTTYSVTLSYQDSYSNPAASVTNTNIQTLAPPAISYTPSTVTYLIGDAASLTASNTGGTITSFIVSPSLPAGLSLNTNTGAITGTTLSYTPRTTYSITARNAAGSSTALVSIFVDRDSDEDGVPDSVEQTDGTSPNNGTDAQDSDGDGVPDYVEVQQGTDPTDADDATDTDGDGVPDYVETVLWPNQGLPAGNPTVAGEEDRDTDGDGVPDYQEVVDGTNPKNDTDSKDTDGDGVPDYVEVQEGSNPNNASDATDTDGDGIPDYVETVLWPNQGLPAGDPNVAGEEERDTDGDGVPDYQEVIDGTNPKNDTDAKDTDEDGVPDSVEVQQGTNPSNPDDVKDTDGDGVPDYVETVLWPNQGLPAGNPNSPADGTRDTDKDGVPDYQEVVDGTDPADGTDANDSDGDGVPDYIEVAQGTNPNNASDAADTDGDGVPDYVETVLWPNQGLPAGNPNAGGDQERDSDGDGVSDYEEVQQGTNPTDDTDAQDSDGDGVPDTVEEEQGTDPNDATDAADTDGDGVPDYVETVLWPNQGLPAGNPNAGGDQERDTDGDGVPDFVEVQQGTDPADATDTKDSDGDGVPDQVEIVAGTDPNDPTDGTDTDGDGVPDYVETVLWPNQGLPAGDPNTAGDQERDTDEDGVPDYIEIQQGTNPSNPADAKDSDGDGVPDYLEIVNGTDINDPKDFDDSDGDSVPDFVETQQGTSPSNASDFKDMDGDGLPDYVENVQGTDPEDASDFKDTDGDGVPDYVEVQQGTNPSNATDAKDTDGDGVADHIQFRSIQLSVLEEVVVLWGDKDYLDALPKQSEVTLFSGAQAKLDVVWTAPETVNILKRGTYELTGTLVLPKGVYNPYGVNGLVRVVVLPKPAPQDVTITKDTFVGSTTQFFISVGDFVVNDPVDNIHVVSLLGDGYDNKFFEIKSNILFWSSADRAPGKTSFSIVVRVTDRDGNTLDKFFTINRTRLDFNSLVITNAFTPNGDGSNDGWGVNDLRFYEGVRISVYDRGGSRLFYTENPDIRWDGTYNGKEMPVASYFWTIEIGETGETRRGMLNLIRK